MADDHFIQSDGEPLVLRSPNDLLVAVPYLLGFHPVLSVVALAYGGPTDTAVVRVDLPDPGDAELVGEVARDLAGVVARNRFRAAHLIGYGPDELVRPVLDAVRGSLHDQCVDVEEVMRAEDGRWWSLSGQAAGDGTPYDLTSSAVAAQAVVKGLVAFPERGDVEALLNPVEGAGRAAMREATLGAERRVAALLGGETGVHQRGKILAREAVPLIEELLTRARTGGAAATDEELAHLSVLLADMRVRDEAWIRIDGDQPEPDVSFWLEVVRRVEPAYLPAPCCLLAYAALLDGNGPLADFALEKAHRQAPDCSMAELLHAMARAGISPAEIRITLTPEDLAQQWDEQAHGDQHHDPRGNEHVVVRDVRP